MYTLIIPIAIYGADYRSAGSPAITSVPGFSTEQACLNAKAKLMADTIPNANYQTSVTKAICVSSDV